MTKKTKKSNILEKRQKKEKKPIIIAKYEDFADRNSKDSTRMLMGLEFFVFLS